MLSIFPELFTYQQIAPFIIRLVLAIIFLSHGYSIFFKNRKFHIRFIGSAEIIAGGLLLIGFLTQLAAILISIITIISAIKIKSERGSWVDYEYNFLILACAIALLFLGPGILSFDIPL